MFNDRDLTRARGRLAAAVTAAALFVLMPNESAASSLRADKGIISEEVRISSEPGIVLAGTLTKPRRRSARPLPVVLTIAGTGPWTRRADPVRSRLHAVGIATLVYDKRGLGESTGAFVDTLPVMQRDVSAAIAFLRSRRDIDPRRIALVGRSQGAVAAPAVAAEMPDIAAIVMLSGPVGKRGELFLGILRTHLAAAGKSQADIAAVLLAAEAWMDARGQAADRAKIATFRDALTDAFVGAGFTRVQAREFVATLDTPVVLSMYESAPDQALARVRAPVLAVFGARDDLIAPARSAAAAVDALSDNPDAMVVMIPGLDHVLARTGADAKPITTSARDPTADSVVDLVVGWLGSRLNTRR